VRRNRAESVKSSSTADANDFNCICAFRIRPAEATPSLLRSYGGRRQNFQVPLKTAKMWIENPKTIVATAEENYISRPEHSFAVAAGRKF